MIIKTWGVNKDDPVILQRRMSFDCFQVTEVEFGGTRCQIAAYFHFLFSEDGIDELRSFKGLSELKILSTSGTHTKLFPAPVAPKTLIPQINVNRKK